MNILILSVGTRNKIVQYFKKELKGQGLVIATDASELAPALYDADKHYIVPRIDADEYIETIKKICIENNVKGILSLIDPELSVLAKAKQEFIDIGVTPIISDLSQVDLCFDKYLFNERLKKLGFNAIRSYIDKEQFFHDLEKGIINYPVFVKPICGSASINISKAYSKEEIEFLFKRYDNLMIQEFMNGKEFGVDVYIDMISNTPTAVFIKEKLLMRAGETDKSVSVHDKELEAIIKKFVTKMELKGIIDVDVFKVNNKYYISEVNPRFGGGYPHAYECGVNIPKLIMRNILGYKCDDNNISYDKGIYMMKYNDLKIMNNV
jgi:carbamoyl-phosphate synthase large subunit